MEKRNQGITLIALIITIIIMLILVAVSIQVLINSGLFETSRNAGLRTEEAYKNESTIGNKIVIDGKKYVSMEDYTAGIVEQHNWQYIDSTLAAVKCECEECKEINSAGVTYIIGQEIQYTAGPEGTLWKVFGIEDCNINGTNETLLITTLKPSTEILSLEGSDGYINGIAKIEAKVKEIYGNKARAMTIEDVNRTLGYTPTGGMYFDDNGVHVLDGFETTYKDYVVNIIENGEITEEEFDTAVESGELISPEPGKNVGDYKIDGYLYTIEDFGNGIPYAPTTTSNVVKALVFGTSDSPYVNWLASRGVGAESGLAFFGPGTVRGGLTGSIDGLFCSNGYTNVDELPVRAVIPLRSEIPEGVEIVEPENIDDWEYTVEEDGTITITGYKGNDTEVVIPNCINGVPVTAINPKKGGIGVGENDVSIWDKQICDTSVYTGSGITWATTLITSVRVSEGIEYIENYSFFGTINLQNVVLPQSLIKIGYQAFSNCRQLAYITIPKSVQTMGAYAFSGEDSITINVKWKEGEKPEGWEDYWDSGNVTINYTK